MRKTAQPAEQQREALTDANFTLIGKTTIRPGYTNRHTLVIKTPRGTVKEGFFDVHVRSMDKLEFVDFVSHYLESRNLMLRECKYTPAKAFGLVPQRFEGTLYRESPSFSSNKVII